MEGNVDAFRIETVYTASQACYQNIVIISQMHRQANYVSDLKNNDLIAQIPFYK